MLQKEGRSTVQIIHTAFLQWKMSRYPLIPYICKSLFLVTWVNPVTVKHILHVSLTVKWYKIDDCKANTVIGICVNLIARVPNKKEGLHNLLSKPELLLVMKLLKNVWSTQISSQVLYTHTHTMSYIINIHGCTQCCFIFP